MKIKKFYLFCFLLIQVIYSYNICYAQEFHGSVSLPVYNGGLTALKEFILNNTQQPKESLKDGIRGIVTVSYTLTEKGKIENIKILRGINTEFDSEAVRVTNLIIGWKPAVQCGKPISVRLAMPVEFYLKENSTKEESVIVSGNVINKATGNPIEGTLIIVKGTNNGAITNEDGFYQISIPGEELELEYSSVGYGIKSQKIGENRTINVELIPDDIIVDFSSNQLK